MPEPQPICPSCNYPLGGLPDEGTCPECGHLYTHASARPSMPVPSRRRVIALLAAPLVIVVGSFAIMLLDLAMGAGGGACLLFVVFSAGLLWMCIATPVIIGTVYRSHRGMGREGGWWTALGLLGLLPRVLAVINFIVIVLSVLGFGACFIALSNLKVY